MMLKDLVKKFGVLLVLTMLVAVCVGAGSAADWTTYLGNDQRNGYVAEDGPQTNKTLWMFDNPQMNQYIQSPVVSGDKVYFSILGGSLTPNLYCYNITTGTQEWSQTIESGARAGITISDDSLYVSSYNSQTSVGEVFKVDLETGAIEGHTGELVKVGTYGLTSTPIISEDSVWINTYKEVTSSSVETHLYEYSLDLAEQKNKIVIANTTGGSGGYMHLLLFHRMENFSIFPETAVLLHTIPLMQLSNGKPILDFLIRSIEPQLRFTLMVLSIL